MADIKLYGKIHNQDGNLLVSPLEVAGVNTDGSIPEGAATSKNNIVSYINEKIKGVNTNVGNIKTGIKSVSVSGTLEPGNIPVDITVTGNDGSTASGKLSITGNTVKRIEYTSAPNKISFGSICELGYLKVINWDGTSYNTCINIELPDNNAVGEAWELSQVATNYTHYVTNAIGTAKTEAIDTAATDATSKSNKALTDAKKYADDQIGMKLGKVYKPQGNASLATIVTINPKNNIGNVWNMTEEFRIDGKVYSQYTNIVIVDNESLPETLIYDAGTKSKPGQGFSGNVVDALGGMIDQPAIQDGIIEKFNKSVIGISTDPTHNPIPTFNPITECDITQSITYTLGDNTTGTFDIHLYNNGAGENIKAVDGKKDIVSKVNVTKKDAGFTLSYAEIQANGELLDCTQDIDFKATSTTYGMVKAGDNIRITDTGIISVPSASTTLGVVKTSSNSSVSIADGLLDVKLATDSGINKSATGELSITKNTFTAGTGIDIKKTGNDFSIGFSTTYITNSETSSGTPLYYNTKLNGFYIDGDGYVNVSTNTSQPSNVAQISINIKNLESGLNLSSKADKSVVDGLTSRVEALESLLSLG